MKNFKLILGSLIVGLALAVGGVAGGVSASEGTAELRNVVDGPTRCWAASVLMREFNYKIILSCRDLIYPATSDVFNYTLWAKELGSDKNLKLGSVGVGKGEYSSDKAFSTMFVTQERTSNSKNPSDRVIMSGVVQRIDILENPPDLVGQVEVPISPDNAFLQGVEEPSPEPEAKSSRSAFSVFRIVIGVFVGIVVLVVIVGIISASRRRPIE